ncbi:MAG: hypothetical protein K0R40_3761 [Burkholderiales bacterium]|nr:hypothetical protein [Burkholderiales bacterium]
MDRAVRAHGDARDVVQGGDAGAVAGEEGVHVLREKPFYLGARVQHFFNASIPLP